MNFYHETILQMRNSLINLQSFIARAEEHATALKFDPDNYLAMRLFPNMLPFSAQLRIACDISKFAAAYLSGKTPPVHEDTEKTLVEYKERIQKVIDYLATFSEADFADAATRQVSPANFKGKYMTGHDYLVRRQVPNFYFHIVTAYDLLRHGGVPLGKTDFLGELPMRE